MSCPLCSAGCSLCRRSHKFVKVAGRYACKMPVWVLIVPAFALTLRACDQTRPRFCFWWLTVSLRVSRSFCARLCSTLSETWLAARVSTGVAPSRMGLTVRVLSAQIRAVLTVGYASNHCSYLGPVLASLPYCIRAVQCWLTYVFQCLSRQAPRVQLQFALT